MNEDKETLTSELLHEIKSTSKKMVHLIYNILDYSFHHKSMLVICLEFTI